MVQKSRNNWEKVFEHPFPLFLLRWPISMLNAMLLF